MQTLILVAHPEIDNSPTQQFLQASLPQSAVNDDQLIWHDLTAAFAKNGWSRETELTLLEQADRIIWQFPLYWYSAPAILKQWQEAIFTGEVSQYEFLAGKELGLVVSLGEKLASYQAGAREQFTLSEILRPYQAFAQKLGWRYLAPLMIEQFSYLTDSAKQKLLVDYQQYLTLKQPASFAQRGQWLLAQLQQIASVDSTTKSTLALAQEQLADQLADYQDLQTQLQEIRRGEHD
ncbi:NAD(P)H-dependent oxidoreductase [Lapidilactobacillus wuchangensis]|uniref:NAD(P)H-dependent oxidoreductase n=1 Tax=Lapidilactobacillus wuchangensis TaxID=2486001 RepID=UPI000F768BBE|nr:NAD(P)H-dependent oxidoreductase [Lapidilactobacillus wuchangensis]